MRSSTLLSWIAVGLALVSPAIAHADCPRFRIGVESAGGTALALIASGASLDGVAYHDKQTAHEAPTLGGYKADFREADRISTAGGALLAVGIAAGFFTGVASAVGFTGRGACNTERPRVTPANAGFQVHF